MVSQLVKHERIETTLAKAKEVRRKADQMVQLGKEGSGCKQPSNHFGDASPHDGWVLILKREDRLTAFLLHLCEGWQQIELIHWLRGRRWWAPGFLIVKGKLGVEGNSVQRAVLPCMGAQRGGQARRGRDQRGGKACCERDLSMEGKLAIKEELGTEGRWD
ncbi:unnamed protein product [Miscanthus lutarioriparius]|uniref:Ribosomal protein L17 n=1 Tax=Miscanthus lutarioriparius TaxID=422564 RepID=A0A811P893_9POAL|nr:unnamed protein product [Miscanthus lutarioriparius]